MSASASANINPSLDPRVTQFLGREAKQLLINGKWTQAKSGKTFTTVNPASERVLGEVAEADKADVDEAVKAARKAFEEGPWPRMRPSERARFLFKLADMIDTHAKEFAQLDSLDAGLNASLLQVRDVPGAAEGLRFAAGWATKIYGETNPTAPDVFSYTLREPVGVCGIIIPWNAPFGLVSGKMAVALACGNTVVIKPAEQTPLSAIRFGELLLEAGLPDGVVNILTGFGPGAGSAISQHPDIDALSFTGSVETGREILKLSAGNFKKVVLELGGKSPHVIFADADMDAALASAMYGIFTKQGQVCWAGSRVFVQRQHYDEFAGRFAEQAAALKVGDPLDSTTQIGPLVSDAQYRRVTGFLEAGKKEGASIKTGGAERPFPKGYFVKPTVFTGVNNRMRIAQEEIFGPVASVIPFTDEEDAVFQGNDTSYGLAAGVWTKDISRAHRVARRLKAGSVWINCYGALDHVAPFGGYKQSGIGREGGKYSIDFYTQVKAVTVKL